MPTLVQRTPTGSTTATAARRRPVRRLKILLAALLALLLHGVLILLLAWGLPHWPRPPMKKRGAPITLTIQPSEPSETPGLHKTETIPQQPDYMRTNDDQQAATPPPDPKYISDKDTNAASEKPAEDPFKPLPTQDGKEIAAFDFATNSYVPGKEAHDNNSVADPATSQPAQTPMPEAKDSPTPPPDAPPTPTPGEFLTLKPRRHSLEHSAPAFTQPRPEDFLHSPGAGFARATGCPRPAENPTVNNRSIPQPAGYQPQTTQTKMSGSTKDLGKSSVAALGTPLGKYEKAVSDVIGSRWYQLVGDRMSDLVRTENVQIHFVVTRGGKIVGIRANGAKKDTILASISIQAINESELPPIPDNVAATLPEGQLDVDFTFGLFE